MPGSDSVESLCPLCHRHFADPHVKFCRYDGAVLQAFEALGAKWLGQTINGKYRVVRFLGSGATADVYEAEHLDLAKRVAIKLLNEESSANAAILQRFRQEAKLVSLLSHPNVVTVEDFGTLANGTLYMVMELLNGCSLESMLAQGQLSEQRTLDTALQICDGLAAAHDRQVIHRDVKPGNVFLHHSELKPQGCVAKLLDLGLAKHLTDDLRSNLTITGTIFGTPEYMSPEQALGANVDARTDLYAFGVMLYEMLFGSVPFTATSFIAILTKHMTEPPPWSREREAELRLNARWKDLILGLMAKKPENRPQTVGAVKLQLQEIASELPAFADTLPPAPSKAFAPKAERLSIRSSTIEVVMLGDEQGTSHELVELAPDVYWVGHRNGYLLECNSYLRRYHGNSTTIALLIDPGPPKDLAVISAKIAAVIGSVGKLDFLFLNHQDPDVCGNAAALQQTNPRLRVICSEDTWRLVQFYGLRHQNHIATESYRDGRMQLATSHIVQFVPSPFCHFRGATMLYDVESRVLFSGDLFGGLSHDARLYYEDSSWHDIEVFHELYMPSSSALEFAVKQIRGLDPAPCLIAPQHGAVIPAGLIPAVLDRMEHLAVGIDLVRDSVGKSAYLALANAVVRGLESWLGSEDIAALLRLYSADGSFPNLFVVSDARTIVDIKVEPRAALRALIRDALELCDTEHRVDAEAFLQSTLEAHGLDSALRSLE